MTNASRALLATLVCSAVFAIVPYARDASSAPSAPPPRAARTLDDYRHFRTATIDLVGRTPTRAELAEFERPSFDFDAWIDRHLSGPAYVERLTRIYMDLLRLEPNLNFSTGPAMLLREEVLGPDGKKVYVYFRANQRRARPETDGEFCFAPAESGVVVRPFGQPVGALKKLPKAVFERETVLVKPWWLYRDYRSPSPAERWGEGWTSPDPEFRPDDALLTDPDGTPTREIRVCREEAQTAAEGHVFASGRAKAKAAAGEKLAGGRVKPPPADRPYATKHKGEPIACGTKTALEMSVDCGCGIGLERCIPNDGDGRNSAFFFPNHMPLGPDLPLDAAKQQSQRWFPYWWSREAVHFIDDLFASDRDFREILTGRQTFVNGPLAQFYRTIQQGNCCGPEAGFGMIDEKEPLFEPGRVPAGLEPSDASVWRYVADRGPHAAGILTMPMFLEKYASARARGAALYNAFLCKSFISENTQLTPSQEPNLMKRPGCQNCHATLEPLAAYFARVEPASFVFLPQAQFPTIDAKCKKDRNGKLAGNCNALYDVAFTDASGATLRSAYGSLEHADAAPEGAGRDIVATPDFAACAVKRVTSSFLGRQTTPDDQPLLDDLKKTFTRSGYRMRALVRAIVRSNQYLHGNNARSADAGVVTAPAPVHALGGAR